MGGPQPLQRGGGQGEGVFSLSEFRFPVREWFFCPSGGFLHGLGLDDLRIYDFRHTCATLPMAVGENPKTISERLGHANITNDTWLILSRNAGYAGNRYRKIEQITV